MFCDNYVTIIVMILFQTLKIKVLYIFNDAFHMMHALIDTCTSRPPLFYLLGRKMALQLESLILYKIT